MDQDPVRDMVTIEDESGNELQYGVEALFDMEGASYALLHSEEDTILMRVEEDGEEQFLVGITNEDEKEAILVAYQIAVDAAPAE